MTSTAEPLVITEPGLYSGIPDEIYHGDPVPSGSLSSTFARLLTENVPAKAKGIRENRVETDSMRLGKAAHAHALGTGPDLIVWQYDGRTKEGKAERAELAPLLATEAAVAVSERERDQIVGMAEALKKHELAVPLLASGAHEVSAFWQDEATGAWLRARFDILPTSTPGRRLIVPDYKTCKDASPRGFQKSVANYGYHQQADFYLRAIRALGLGVDPVFVFIAQETSAPYLVNVFECDPEAMEVARVLNDRAIRVFAECQASGVWPGYEAEVQRVALPPFYFYDHKEMLE